VAATNRCGAPATTFRYGRLVAATAWLETAFGQTRPDRRTVIGHARGIPFSGKREDAFPSGHALHMGALASAAGTWPAAPTARSGRLRHAFG
jgi:hypothetical protein